VKQFGDDYLYVTVEPGDLLEVVGEVPGNIPATIRVVQVLGTLKAPAEGDEIHTFGERDLLAWIVP